MGYKVSGTELYDLVHKSFDHFDFSSKVLPVSTVKPEIESKDIEPLFDEVKKLVSKDFKVLYDDASWNLTPKQKLEFFFVIF